MKKKPNRNTPGKPMLRLPAIPPQTIYYQIPKKVQVYEFYTIGDGERKTFRQEDGVGELGIQLILSPCQFSYMNLFINGVLQPKESYTVEKGEIHLLTVDAPEKDSLIILQMIKS